MPVIRIPTPLRSYTESQAEVQVKGQTVAEAMEDLVHVHPSLRTHLYNGTGQLRPFVNLFLNEDNVKDLEGMQTTLGPNDRLMLIPSIAGGR